MKTCHSKYSFALSIHSDVRTKACIDVFYCNKPSIFVLHEKKPAQV